LTATSFLDLPHCPRMARPSSIPAIHSSTYLPTLPLHTTSSSIHRLTTMKTLAVTLLAVMPNHLRFRLFLEVLPSLSAARISSCRSEMVASSARLLFRTVGRHLQPMSMCCKCVSPPTSLMLTRWSLAGVIHSSATLWLPFTLTARWCPSLSVLRTEDLICLQVFA
jgi:hypothetical protein